MFIGFLYIFLAKCGSGNTYSVRDVYGEPLFHAVEENNCLCRWFCGPQRKFDLKVFDNEVLVRTCAWHATHLYDIIRDAWLFLRRWTYNKQMLFNWYDVAFQDQLVLCLKRSACRCDCCCCFNCCCCQNAMVVSKPDGTYLGRVRQRYARSAKMNWL